jgi:hypothetical protein
MTASDVQFSLIESALYLSVFADGTGGANRDWVHVLFSEFNIFMCRSIPVDLGCWESTLTGLMNHTAQERLPYAEGWTRPTEELTTTSVLTMAAQVGAAS